MPDQLPWICRDCITPIENDTGFLFIPGKQLRIWYAQQYSDREFDYPARLFWKTEHQRCSLPSFGDYRMNLTRCRTIQGFNRTGTYLADTKPWFRESDWHSLIDLLQA